MLVRSLWGILCSTLLPAQATAWSLGARVVADEDGRPLAGCTVELTGHQATGYPLHWSWLDWYDPDPVTTDAEGRFSFQLPVMPGRGVADGWPARVHVTVHTAGRVSLLGTHPLSQFHADPDQDLSEMRMPRGRPLRVRVVDRSGVPVAGCIVSVSPATKSSPSQQWYWPLRWGTSAPSDQEGFALFDRVFPAGAWRLSQASAGDASTQVVVEAAGEQALDVQLPVDPPPRRQRARLIDARGTPATDQDLVLMWREQAGQRAARVRSDADGWFGFEQVPPSVHAVTIREEADDYSRDPSWGPLDPDAADLQLVRAGRGRLRLSVSVPDGIACDRCAVHLVPVEQVAGVSCVRRVVRVRDGLLELDGVGAGGYSLRVHACGTPLWPSEWTHVHVGTGDGPPVSIRLEAPIEREVFVFSQEGRPIVDGSVELVFAPAESLRDARARDSAVWTGCVYDRTMTAEGPDVGPYPAIASRGRTDRAGRVRLAGRASREPVCVRVRGGGAQDALVELSEWTAAPQPLRIDVPDAGSVPGRLLGKAAELAPMRCKPRDIDQALRCGPGHDPWRKSMLDLREECGTVVVLRRLQKEPDPAQHVAAWDAEGRFEFDAVDPGRWELFVVDRVVDGAGKHVDAVRAGVRANVEVRAGAAATVDLAFAPETGR